MDSRTFLTLTYLFSDRDENATWPVGPVLIELDLSKAGLLEWGLICEFCPKMIELGLELVY